MSQGSDGKGACTGRTSARSPLRRSLPASSSAAGRVEYVASRPCDPST